MSDKIIIGNNIFDTLVAVTEDEHARGLMYKKWPPPVMIFPYKTADVRRFWMRNTISPLDIIFCKENKIVDIKYGEPLSTKLIGPIEPVDLVIELPYGTAKNAGIKIGDDVSIVYSTQTLNRILVS